MAIIRTLEGEYYEVPDEVLDKYRVPQEEAARHTGRVRKGLRIDVAEEFRTVGDGKALVEPSAAPSASGRNIAPKGV